MKRTIGGLFGAVMFIAASLHIHAQGLVYDQQSATGPNSPPADDFLNIQEDSPLTQSFVPTLKAIGFVQFEFWDIANNGNNGATVYVNLWTGSPNINSATLLGSTMPVYMPNGFVNNGLGYAGITNFNFSTLIALIPGQTYYLQPVVQSGDDPWDVALVGDTYSNGQLFEKGLGFSTDMWFREGVVSVPEPTTLALIVLIGLLVFGFRRRSRLFVLLVFIVSVLSVRADSVVQATADAAGLTSVSAAALPGNGTFWIMTVDSDGNLVESPYPMLPDSLSTLPIYSLTNDIYMVDNTGGQLMLSSSRRMSAAQAASTAQTQAATTASLIEQIISPADDTDTNSSYQPDGQTYSFDTNGLWLESINKNPTNLWLRLHNTVEDENYQLLSTTNLASQHQLGFGGNQSFKKNL
jgi:hypothetical protein